MSDRSIYTITFHSADNYGAVWQAYALQSYLQSKGVASACVDYRPAYLNKSGLNGKFSMKLFLQSIITYPSRLRRRLSFAGFRKTFINIISIDAINNNEATFIVGSDQIWNKTITGGQLDPMYLLETIISTNKYSYAASIGHETAQNITEVYNNLKCFKGIGVREENVFKLMSAQGDSRVVWNVDPVFLLNKDEYRQIVPKVNFDKYVLIYTLETNMEVCKVVEKYRGTHRIISIGSFRNIYKSDVHYRSASPQEFVQLISNADVVVSNSFHTIAFSIIFERIIEYIPLKNGRGGRINTLFSLIGSTGNYCDSSKCDKTKLNNLIDESKKYLQEIIRNNPCLVV